MKSLFVLVVLTLSLALPQGGKPAVVGVAESVPVGGSRFICMATGLLFGAAVLSGNVLAASGALISALDNGCL